jgi:hypothetical protein
MAMGPGSQHRAMRARECGEPAPRTIEMRLTELLTPRSRSASDPTGPFLLIVLDELRADTVHVREYAARRVSEHPPANLRGYRELRGRLLEALLDEAMPQAVGA